jgi:hypothetical protein
MGRVGMRSLQIREKPKRAGPFGRLRVNEPGPYKLDCVGLAVGGGVGGDFSGEGAVDVGEVDGCEDHADEPPG